jgi:hypothetical protein
MHYIPTTTIWSLVQDQTEWIHELSDSQSLPQYVHAIRPARQDEKEMVRILDRLDRAKNELGTRVLLAQVGLTGIIVHYMTDS